MAGVVALNLQASQELGMTPEGLVEGSKIFGCSAESRRDYSEEINVEEGKYAWR